MAKEKIPMWKKGLNALRRGLALACAALIGGAAVAAPAAPSYELSFWALMPGGTASGAGMHEAGKKVTLKATPEKGYVFAGWYEVDHGTAYRLEGDVDFRTPTYSYMMPPSNIVICAEFVPVTNDVAEISPMVGATVVSEVACTTKAEIEHPIVLSVVNCKSLPTVTVKGLPPGLKFTAKKLTNSDGTVLKANTVYGAPTKSGVYEMTATVTTATKKTATTTVTFVVADHDKGDRVLRIAYDKESGKVSGAGVYASGKKVTLKATPAKGYVFAGWHKMDGSPLVGEGGVDYRTQSLQYVMEGDDIEFFAKFLPDYRDDARLTVRIDGEEATELVCKPKAAIGQVVLLDVADCVTLPTVKVTGLPPGLKFTAKALDVKATKTTPAAHYDANTIYGTPTKSGVYAATVTVTTAGKRTATETVLFAVVDRDKGERVLKIASDTAKGKVTGAGVYAAGKKVTLRATPAKGFFFAGWYKADGSMLLGDGGVDGRTPSIAYVMPNEDAQVAAQFRSATDPLASEISLMVGVDPTATEAPGRIYNTSGAWKRELSVGSASLPTITLTGLPPGLKFTTKALDVKATATTPAAHYEANTVYGTATKPGTYPVKAKITNATVKKAVERWFTIVVDNLTGANGLLLVTDAASGVPVSLKNGRGQQYTVYVGVEKHEIPAITVNDSADRLTLAGLPAGLKYDAKLGAITGVPTKAGFYTVTATVRSGRESSVSTFTVEVVALPEWAVGTFVGSGICEFEGYTPFTNNLHCTMTVAANGKVSGKVIFDTGDDRLLTATFSKPFFAEYNKGAERYTCDVRILFKDGRDVVVDQVRRLCIAPSGVDGLYSERIGVAWMNDRVDEETGESDWDGTILCVFQNAWKRKDFEDLPQFAEKKTTVSVTDAALPPDPSEPEVAPGTADLTLDIAQNGTVTATLALKDGGKIKKLVTKGDLIVYTADFDEYGTLVYSAYVSLVFGNLGLLHVDVELGALKDGVILADYCRIVSVDRFAAEEAEEETDDGE